jgi:hypothetical protein
MFWGVRRPHINPDDEAWVIECWAWLTTLLGPVDGEPRRELLLPSRQHFPTPTATGHALAQHYFDLVQRYMGLSDRRYELVAQEERFNPGSSLAFGAVESKGAGGTYSMHGNQAYITYDPGLLDQPTKLVAVFAHELAHDILLSQPTEPPGGRELEELATDLATAHLGFGLFGVNTAFDFHQFSNFDGASGWSYSRSGYLGESEWGFAIALFLALQDRDPMEVAGFMKTHLVTVVKRAHKYLLANSELIAPLRKSRG